MKQQLEEIRGFKLYAEEGSFFLPNFCDNSFFKKQMVKRYSEGITRWKRYINSGTICSGKKVKMTYLCKYNKTAEDILCIYSEKKRKKDAIIFCDNAIGIDGEVFSIEDISIVLDGLYCNDKKIDLLMTEEFMLLIEDLKAVMFQSNSLADFHPCRKYNYCQREYHIKIMILFAAINIGISAQQIIHIGDVAQQFEIKSKGLLSLFKMIYDLSREDQIMLLKDLYQNLNDKDYVLIDIIALSTLGNYDEKEKDLLKKILITDLSIEEQCYYKILYYIEKEIKK